MSTVNNRNDAVKMSFDPASGIATLTLEMEGRANKINETFGLGLRDALEWANKQEGLVGIVIGTGHKDFCVGADIDKLYKERDPAKVLASTTGLNELFRMIETSKKPVVAALTGSALGGGYELALSCHHRVALDSMAVQFGLPEVTLGVIPGAGGTQRLPRLIGIQSALDHTAQGKMVRAPKAVAAGLVDDLAETKEAVHKKAVAWIKANPKFVQPWLRPDFRWPAPRPGSEDARNLILAGCGMLRKKTAGVYPAPETAIAAVQEGSILSFDRALEVEGRYFAGLATSDQAKDMIRTIWFHRTAAEKQEGLPKTDAMDIDKVGILGAGMMGAGLAFVCAEKGFTVVLKDIDQGALDRGYAHCEKQVNRMKWLPEAERAAILDRITPTLELGALEGSDLIIEAVIEKLEVKHIVNGETEGLLSERGIWASNTSALPISDLAKSSKRPEKFIGLHFFSPVEKMPLIEIIKGADTDEDTLARSLAFAKRIKKTPIVVNDGYGFYTSRTFSAYILEAAQLVAEGHDPVLIEWAAKSAGMVVPPLQVFDEVTLSLARHAMEGSKKYIEHSLDVPGVKLIETMVDGHDRTGKAAGQGFYDYANGKRRGFWKGLKDLVAETPEETGVELLQDRLMLIQVAEVIRTLEAGVLTNHRDAEVGALLGIGFAPNTGGPLSYVDRRGARNVVNRLDELQNKYGVRFKAPDLLRNMAETGQRFFDDA